MSDKPKKPSKIVVHRLQLPLVLESFLTSWGKLLEQQSQPKVFCRRCRQEVPDRKEFCLKCEKQVELDARIQARLLPHIKIVGVGMDGKEKPYGK